MADKPIIFSAPMVRALIEGRKTQTRRVLKPQPISTPEFYLPMSDEDAFWATFDEDERCTRLRLRYAPGDRLWVREAFIGPYAYEVNEYPPRPTTSAIGAASEVIFLRIVALLRIATSMRPAVVMPPDSSVCN